MVFNNGSQQQQQRQALTVPILLNSGSQHSGPLLCHVDMHYIYSNSITASAAEKVKKNITKGGNLSLIFVEETRGRI